MMSSASIAIIRQSIRPRAAPMTTRRAPFISLLSDVFDRQCNLSSLVNDFSSRTASSFTSWSSTWGLNLRPLIPTAVTTDVTSYHNRHHHHQIKNLIGRCRRFASDTTKAITPPPPTTTTGGSGSSQHDTWVQFQRSIAVAGFETGQTTKEKNLGKKNRGGKIDRKRKEREAEAEAAMRGEDVTQLKGGEFPTLRYSDEETERLLAEAYAAIPPRAGKRGTLNLQRQKRRAFIKLQYAYKKKLERIGAHERRMAKRKSTNDAIKKIQSEADDVVAKEKEYQNTVLQRWAMMNGIAELGGSLTVSSENVRVREE